MSKPNGIALLVPSSGRHVCIEWAAAIRQLVYPVGMNQFMTISKPDPNIKEPQRDKQREKMAEWAVAAGAEFSMWVDDDTIPPARAIVELHFVMAQNPNAAIVGGIYCTKEVPPSPIVFETIGGGPFWHWTLGDVFKCAALGTGCMLVRNSILKDIPKPWFKDTATANLGEVEHRNGVEINITGHTGTDDVYFCKKVAAAGYDIIAHGGILPVHVDYSDNDKAYKLPRNSYPVVSYQERLDAVNANLPEGEKKIIL